MPRTNLTPEDCSPFTQDGPGLHAKLKEHDAALDGLEGADEVTGARDDPEEALANLLTVLAAKGIITDETTES